MAGSSKSTFRSGLVVCRFPRQPYQIVETKSGTSKLYVQLLPSINATFAAIVACFRRPFCSSTIAIKLLDYLVRDSLVSSHEPYGLTDQMDQRASTSLILSVTMNNRVVTRECEETSVRTILASFVPKPK